MISTIVERYKSLRNKKSEEQPDVDPLLNQTYLQLYRAQRAHHFLEVRVDGDDAIYQSMVLAVDPEEKTLLIDELFPTGFVGLPGQRVHVAIRQPEGRKIKFGSTILAQHEYEEAPVYVLAMPEAMDSDQRRNAYRLPIAGGYTIRPQFVGPDKQEYPARLCNVSTSGLALEVELDDPENFHRNKQLSHIAFDFAGINVDCDIAVRNVVVADEARHKVLVGAEFVDLPPLEQRVLEKSIMRIQRDRIRLGGEQETQMAIA